MKEGRLVRALDFVSSGSGFKTTGWLQGQLILPSFQGRSNEYQDLLGLVVKSKLSPRSGSVAVRQLTPSIKRDHIFFYENAICSWSNLKVYLNDQSEHWVYLQELVLCASLEGMFIFKSSETRESAFCDIKKIGGLFKVCLIVVP